MFLAEKIGKGDKRGMIVGIGIEIRVDCTGVHDELLSISYSCEEVGPVGVTLHEIVFPGGGIQVLTFPIVSISLEESHHCYPFLDSMDLDSHVGFDFHCQKLSRVVCSSPKSSARVTSVV